MEWMRWGAVVAIVVTGGCETVHPRLLSASEALTAEENTNTSPTASDHDLAEKRVAVAPLAAIRSNLGGDPKLADKFDKCAKKVESRRKVTSPDEAAIVYCSCRRSEDASAARWKEPLGFVLGALGLAWGGVSTALAAKAGDNTSIGLWAGSAGLSLVVAAVGGYLLASASTNRTSAATTDAALVQMRRVDGWFRGDPTDLKSISAYDRQNKYSEAISRLWWQTCAKALMTAAQGAGSADTTAASVFAGGATAGASGTGGN